MKYSGAEIIIKLLEKQGITVVAGIPGGPILPLYSALNKSSIRHILARHEQGAGFIAQGMARSTGRAAVCFATSGPGATNLITAIADAKLDSVPIVAITGQVSSHLIGSDAFQEVDMYGLTVPITKQNYLARSARELLQIIPEAFMIAESDRPGPVVIDVPKDVQQEIVDIETWPSMDKTLASPGLDADRMAQIADLINKSKRPVLYVGGGIIQAGAHELLYELARKASIPVTSTLMGLGCFPPDDPLYLGMLGMHGSLSTNCIMDEADLLLAFGVRFDDRATGHAARFCPKATIVHVDIDPTEINKIKQAHASLRGDIGAVLKLVIPLVNTDARPGWLERIDRMRTDYPVIMPEEKNLYHPINIIKSVSRLAEPDTIVVTDVGQHQMWVAQSYPFRHPRTLLTSGGLGTMGFGLPAAIGAALANPDKRIVCFSGDGSLLMNIQELATLADWRLNVTIILLKNGHLGLVRQQQELFYEKNYIASKFMTNPDFVTIARGFGIRGYDLTDDGSDPVTVFKVALAEPGPCLISVPIDKSANVFPMVPPGKSNTETIVGEYSE